LLSKKVIGRIPMPYYKIIIWLKNGKVHKGIRQIEQWNIDVVYNIIKNKTKSFYRESELVDVDVYMLSKNSREVRKIIKG